MFKTEIRQYTDTEIIDILEIYKRGVGRLVDIEKIEQDILQLELLTAEEYCRPQVEMLYAEFEESRANQIRDLKTSLDVFRKYQVVEDATSSSIHGDKVLFEIVDKHMLTVKIVSTIKRKNTKIAGTYVEYNGIGFVVPDNEKLAMDIYIQKTDFIPNLYDRVLVKIDEYKIYHQVYHAI